MLAVAGAGGEGVGDSLPVAGGVAAVETVLDRRRAVSAHYGDGRAGGGRVRLQPLQGLGRLAAQQLPVGRHEVRRFIRGRAEGTLFVDDDPHVRRIIDRGQQLQPGVGREADPALFEPLRAAGMAAFGSSRRIAVVAAFTAGVEPALRDGPPGGLRSGPRAPGDASALEFPDASLGALAAAGSGGRGAQGSGVGPQLLVEGLDFGAALVVEAGVHAGAHDDGGKQQRQHGAGHTAHRPPWPVRRAAVPSDMPIGAFSSDRKVRPSERSRTSPSSPPAAVAGLAGSINASGGPARR